MTTSMVPLVIDALVSLCTADATLQTAEVVVYDGPTVQDEPAQYVLWIGMDDPDAGQAPTAAEAGQSFPGLGTRLRDEDGTIYCIAEAWDGGRDIRTVRQKVYAIVAAVEQILRADATLGGVITPVAGWAEIGDLTLKQNNVDAGAVARLSFHISYKARI